MLKVYLIKVYHRLQWDFVIRVFTGYGVSSGLDKLDSPMYFKSAVLAVGKWRTNFLLFACGKVKARRPFITVLVFIHLVYRGLACRIQREQMDHENRGIRITCNELEINHLFFC